MLMNADETRSEHRLWWNPGTPGRGVLFDTGLLYTWPEDDGTHAQLAAQVDARPVMYFYIRPDGRVRIPERHAHRAVHLTAALTAADRRLAPFSPADHPARPADRSRQSARRTIDRLWDARAAERLARVRRRY